MSYCPTEYWIWLQSALGAGARTDELLAYFGSPEKLYEAGSGEWKLSGLMSEARIASLKKTSPSETMPILKECRAKGYRIITPDDTLYPERFRTLTNQPLVLYGMGDCSVLLDSVSIGIVGTRDASRYGIETAQRLSFQLASCGVTIVSGAALGIDSEAHAGAMLAKGRTAAFLGCGLSVDYLRENAPLRRAIARHGAVLSEYPPFCPASRATFPIRNRLISGMTLGTVVIEAGVKSGSLITAKCALEQGKDVFAVPGDVIRSSFGGTNHLIQSGAKPVFTASDILSEYEYAYGDILTLSKADAPLSEIPYVEYRNMRAASVSAPARRSAAVPRAAQRPEDKKADKPSQKPKSKEPPADLSSEALLLLRLLPSGEVPVDFLVRESALPMPAVLCALTELELAGLITELPGKHFLLL